MVKVKNRQFIVQPEFVASQEDLHRTAYEQLPPVLRDRMLQTAQPFVQLILDIAVPQMYKGNVVVLGDAASLVRPHTASGTAKAYRMRSPSL